MCAETFGSSWGFRKRKGGLGTSGRAVVAVGLTSEKTLTQLKYGETSLSKGRVMW